MLLKTIPLQQLNNLIFKKENEIVKTKKDEIYDQDALPPLPYEKLNSFYPHSKISWQNLSRTNTPLLIIPVWAAHSPVLFVRVVPIYNARWKGKSAEHIYKTSNT